MKRIRLIYWSLLLVFGVVLQLVAGEGELLATRLLQVTARQEDPQVMAPVADAFAEALPKAEQQSCGLVAKAIREGYWRDVLPRASAGPAMFGLAYAYELGDGASPLADLCRQLVSTLSSPTCEARLKMALALGQAFPDQAIFSYLARGIEASIEENTQYAQLYVRGQQLVKHHRELLKVQEIALAQKIYDVDYKGEKEMTRKVAETKKKLAEAEAMVKQGKAYRPFGESLPPLARDLMETIDELEAIGDL